MDKRRRPTPIILKTLRVDTFDHSASWPAKVRNLSRLGQTSKPQTGFELYTTVRPAPTTGGDLRAASRILPP